MHTRAEGGLQRETGGGVYVWKRSTRMHCILYKVTASVASKLSIYCLVPHAQAFPTVGDHEEDSGTDPSTPLIEDRSLGSNLVGSRLRN